MHIHVDQTIYSEARHCNSIIQGRKRHTLLTIFTIKPLKMFQIQSLIVRSNPDDYCSQYIVPDIIIVLLKLFIYSGLHIILSIYSGISKQRQNSECSKVFRQQLRRSVRATVNVDCCFVPSAKYSHAIVHNVLIMFDRILYYC